VPQGPFWLQWRIALVGRENQIEDVRFLFSPLTTPPLWPPKREYNAVSAIADEIWQYRTGGNLTIFDKDHGTAEEGRSQVRQKQSSCSQACGFATLHVQLVAIWRARVPKRNLLFFLKGAVEAGHAMDCTTLAHPDESAC